MSKMIPPEIIEKLKDLSILSVASKLEINVERKRALCFIHNDTHPSLHFNTEKNTWKCFVCNKGGGIISLVMEKLNLEFVDACKWLADEFNIIIPEDNGYRTRIMKPIKKIYLPKHENETSVFDEEVYGWLIGHARLSDGARKFLFEERRLNEDVVKGLKIGSVTYPKKVVDALVAQFGEGRCLQSGLARKGDYELYFYFYTPCLLFPYYEKDGQLVGIQSRYLGTKKDAPRFQFVASQKTRLFNLPMLNDLKEGERLYISEGITDCLALLSDGKKAVAIPSATILPQEDLIRLKGYDLYIYPDQDEAGQKAFTELRRFFVNHYSTVTAEKLPEGVKDYSEYYIKSHGKR